MYICIYIYTSWNVGKGGKGQLGEMILPQELGVWYIYVFKYISPRYVGIHP